MIQLNSQNRLAWHENSTVYDDAVLCKSIYRIFSSDEGKVLWEYLNRTIINTPISPDMSEHFLYHHNGQKSLVLTLKNIANRGKEY